MSPIVESPDGLDFDIGGNANKIGLGVSYDDNPEELLDTIDMDHMSVLNVEPAGFQTLEHRFNGPSFLVRRKGFLGVAEGYKDLRFGFPGLVLDHGSRQVAELSADAVDVVQSPFLLMFEIIEDMQGTYLLAGPRVFHPEVVPDADMILGSVIVEPLEPFESDELTVSDKAFDAAPAEQADEPRHDINSLLVIGVPRLGAA